MYKEQKLEYMKQGYGAQILFFFFVENEFLFCNSKKELFLLFIMNKNNIILI